MMVIAEPVGDEVQGHIYLAKVCEQTEQFTQMAQHMTAAVKKSGFANMESETRNLLSVAYKNVVGSLRASWRIASSLAMKAEMATGENSDNHKMAKAQKLMVEKELNMIIADAVDIVTNLMQNADKESQIFLLKMKADYLRYQAEYAEGEERKSHVDQPSQAYSAARDMATSELVSCSPIRLGLALNMSCFYYEILDDKPKALQMAQDAFEQAVADLDQCSEDEYSDATLILQLIRDNTTLWAEDDEA